MDLRLVMVRRPTMELYAAACESMIKHLTAEYVRLCELTDDTSVRFASLVVGPLADELMQHPDIMQRVKDEGCIRLAKDYHDRLLEWVHRVRMMNDLASEHAALSQTKPEVFWGVRGQA